MRNFRYRWIVLALLLGALPAYALEASPKTLKSMEIEEFEVLQGTIGTIRGNVLEDYPAPKDDETLNQYRTNVTRALFDAIDQQILAMAQESKNEVESLTPLVVAAKTTAPAVPEGFPERVRESIADFLPFLGLSMDAVSTSDDRKTVSLKLPSWKFRLGALNLSAAAAEPEVFKSLLDEVVEVARDEQQKALQGEIQDLDDVTIALAYGYSSRGVSWDQSRHLYGRDFDSYRDLVDDFFDSTWSLVSDQVRALTQQQGRFREDFLRPLNNVLERRREEERIRAQAEGRAETVGAPVAAFDTPMSEVRGLIASGELGFTEEALLSAIREEATLVGAVDIGLRSEEVDALPSLIDNQPQLVFTLAQRSASELVGPEGTTVTARYEMGSRNFNTLLREYRRLKARGEGENEARLNAYKALVNDPKLQNEEKLIISTSYKWVDSYSFEHPYTQTVVDPSTGEPASPIERTANLSLDESKEWRSNLTYTRFLQRGKDSDNATGIQLPRITLTVEKIWVQDNPGRQNRTIAKLSYVQPTVKGLSIPITLTWADHAEFLGEQDNIFGAHLGLSFKVGQN